MDASIVISLLSFGIAVASVGLAYLSLLESGRGTFQQIYQLIEQHHSSSKAEMRRKMRNLISRLTADSSTQASDEDRQLVSEWMNYYEALGMYLAHGNHRDRTRQLMLAMLHNSTYTSYLGVMQNYDRIFAGSARASDWGRSYRQLFADAVRYRDAHGWELDSAAITAAYERHSRAVKPLKQPLGK